MKYHKEKDDWQKLKQDLWLGLNSIKWINFQRKILGKTGKCFKVKICLIILVRWQQYRQDCSKAHLSYKIVLAFCDKSTGNKLFLFLNKIFQFKWFFNISKQQDPNLSSRLYGCLLAEIKSLESSVLSPEAFQKALDYILRAIDKVYLGLVQLLYILCVFNQRGTKQ